MIEIKYSGHYATIAGLNDDQETAIKKLLSYELPGAEFLTSLKFRVIRGRKQLNPLFNKDPRKTLFEQKYKRFPAGLVPKVEAYLQSENASYEVKGPSLPTATLKGLVDDSRSPRYYQLEAQEFASKNSRGIIVLPTGTGKSMVTGLLANLCEEKVLVTVPNLNLLYQSHQELQKFLGEPIGIVGDGHQDIQRVTIATIQSMASFVKAKKSVKDPISVFINTCSVWIADECHGAATESYVKISKKLVNTNRRYGLTATAFREDNKELVMEGVLGPIGYTYTLEQAMADSVLTPVDILIREVSPTKTYTYKPGYSTVYKDNISGSVHRNKLVIKDINSLVSDNKFPCLVIVDHINHGEYLSKQLNCEFISGKEDSETRTRMLTDFSNSKNKVLVGSSVMNVGVDVPTIKSMVNAAGSKSATLLLQRIGRSLRKHPSKARVTFVDYLDKNSLYIESHSKTRIELYNKYFPKRVQSLNEQDSIK